MLDFGSWEFLIVIVVALVVIGPKDLPALIRNVSMWIRRAKDLARDFQSGLEDMARETELDKMTEDFKSEIDPDGLMSSVKDEIKDTIDPDGEVRGSDNFSDHWDNDDTYEDAIDDLGDLEEHSIADPAAQPSEEPGSGADDTLPAKPEA